MTQRRTGKEPGKLIVLEGPDGVGKTTLAIELAKRLVQKGQPTEVLSFPGRESGTLGGHIYAVHHEPQRFNIDSLTAASKQLLHVAAHLDVIESKIRPWLKDSINVVLDRYWWSTWVYGKVSGVSTSLLDAMIAVERVGWGHTQPTLTVLLRREHSLNSQLNAPEWRELRAQYSDLAMRERSENLVMFLDDSPSAQAACNSIVAVMEKKVPTKQDTLSRQATLIDLTPKEQTCTPQVIITHLSPIRATAAYDTYWRFAAERQEVFFNRLSGRPAPWSDDPILQTFKFTNAYRASDRVSQFLISRVIYDRRYPNDPEEVFFRILLFKLFNKIATWELLEHKIGPILYSEFSFSRYDDILTAAMSRGERIYSGAYIMPSGGRLLGSSTKHRNHLSLLERMMADDGPRKIQNARTMHEGFDILLKYPTIGEFLAYQFIIDLNYSELTSFNEHDFVVPGPGALDGIRKCFVDLGGLNEPELIRFIADQQEKEFDRLGLTFRSLWGRPLQLIDCQNLFCEVDKYSRVYHPEIAGISGRTRIKQRFSQNPASIEYWYPPKWGLNERISANPKNETLTEKAV